MLGPSGAGRPRRRISTRNLGQLVATLGVGLVFVVAASDCGFPEYGFTAAAGMGGVAGASGASGASGAAGVSPAGGVAGSGGSGGTGGGSSGSSGQSGTGGSAGSAGSAGAACVYPAPVTFPMHCFDGAQNDGETGQDCGGGACVPCSSAKGCSTNGDCVSNVCTSGTCTQILGLTYRSIVADQSTPTLKFELSIGYHDKTSTPLQTLRIRYYFNHNGVAEPLLAHTQATYDPGGAQRNLAGSELSYQIHRFPPGPADQNGFVTDSYLEITFPSAASLGPESALNLTQDIVAGSSEPSALFQQTTHYSFINTGSFIPNEAITVYRGDQLVWGVPPPMNLVPDCAFAAGVNLNGPAVIVDNQALQGSSAANVDYSGATYQITTALVPTADAGTTTLLHTGFVLGSATATWPVPNGKYWAYAWLTASSNSDFGQLMIQDNATDKFFGMQQSTVWSRVGPYAIDVLGGSVKLTGTDTVDIAGVELFNVAP